MRKKGLEPLRLAVLAPEASASTNSATFAIYGDPDEIRTHDRRLRKPILYPAELRDHREISQFLAAIIHTFAEISSKIGRIFLRMNIENVI